MVGISHLGGALVTVVDDFIKAGRYGSRVEVLREGVRLIEERERRSAALDSALTRAIADAEAGRVTPLDDVADRLGEAWPVKRRYTPKALAELDQVLGHMRNWRITFGLDGEDAADVDPGA